MYSFTETQTGKPDHAPLSDIGLRMTVGAILRRASGHIPPGLDGIKIEFTNSMGQTLRGDLSSSQVIISKTSPARSDTEWAGYESGVAHVDTYKNPSLTFTKTGSSDPRVQDSEPIPRNSERAKAEFEKIADEFFSPLESKPAS